MSKSIDCVNKVFLEGTHAMTLDYGYTYSNGSFHKGVDLVTGRNVEDYVVAIEEGVVVACENNIKGTNSSTGTAGMGNYVILQHSNGWRTRYQHMKCGSVLVHKGQSVKKGQKLGILGSTGNSSGRHLHFDISNENNQTGSHLANGRYYVDPKPFLFGTRSILGKSSVAKPAYTTGTYKITTNVNVRKGAGTKYDKVSYDEMTPNAKKQIKKIAGKAVSYFPAGMSVSVSQISGNWGKCPSGWICLEYAKKQ